MNKHATFNFATLVMAPLVASHAADAAAKSRSEAKSAAGNPNVLLIVCDELNGYIEGFGGHPRAEPVQFGRQVMRASPTRELFKGSIDEIFIIGTALTGDQIRHLMQHDSLP